MPPSAVSTPVVAVAPVTPGLAEPALSSQEASPSTSKGGLSGEHVCLGAPQHGCSAPACVQQLQQQFCKARKLTRHSMPAPYTGFSVPDTIVHCIQWMTWLFCLYLHCCALCFQPLHTVRLTHVWLVVSEGHMTPDTIAVPHAGGAIFAIILAALILLTAMALASFIIHSKWKSSYVR